MVWLFLKLSVLFAGILVIIRSLVVEGYITASKSGKMSHGQNSLYAV